MMKMKHITCPGVGAVEVAAHTAEEVEVAVAGAVGTLTTMVVPTVLPCAAKASVKAVLNPWIEFRLNLEAWVMVPFLPNFKQFTMHTPLQLRGRRVDLRSVYAVVEVGVEEVVAAEGEPKKTLTCLNML